MRSPRAAHPRCSPALRTRGPHPRPPVYGHTRSDLATWPTPETTSAAEATAWALDRQKRRLRKRQVRLERKSMVESVPKEAEGKSPRRSYARVEDLEAPPPVSVATYPDPLPAGAGHYERAIFWLAYQGARMHERVEELTVQWDTLTYPMRSGQQQNRLFSLLKWDTFASFFCLALFFILVLDAEWAREIVDAGDGREALGRDPLWHVVMVCTDMLSVFGSNFWYEWRTQITFQIIKVLFSPSAMPFFISLTHSFTCLLAYLLTYLSRCSSRPRPCPSSSYLLTLLRACLLAYLLTYQGALLALGRALLHLHHRPLRQALCPHRPNGLRPKWSAGDARPEWPLSVRALAEERYPLHR